MIALLLVVGIPSGFLTSAIQDRVERETGYRLTIDGATKIGVWPSLHVTLNDLTLQDPTQQRDTSNRLTIGSVEADMTLDSVWSGHPQSPNLSIDHPVVACPAAARTHRAGQASPSKPATHSGRAEANALAIDHVTVTDGTMVFSNPRDRVDRSYRRHQRRYQ